MGMAGQSCFWLHRLAGPAALLLNLPHRVAMVTAGALSDLGPRRGSLGWRFALGLEGINLHDVPRGAEEGTLAQVHPHG